MAYYLQQRHRRSIRLQGYDYAQPGAYFVTICTRDRITYFENGAVRTITERCWVEIPKHFPAVELDEWIVMPNHIHGIIVISDTGRGVQLNAPTNLETGSRVTRLARHPLIETPLAVVVRTYKAAVTTQCRRLGHIAFAWQRNYYEHIIRDEDELDRTREYIRNNPLNWDQDENNPRRFVALG